MDLPATQAMEEEEFAPTQQLTTNENNENVLVGTLKIDNKSHSIVSGVTTIGRHPKCTIVISHETVSKYHAEIEAGSVDGTIFIRDLQSCNSTKINNKNLKPNYNYQIKDGDELIFGQVVATFKLYQALDDSLVSCTPQVNRKIRPIIPGTPDSSMNTSSASESDVSIIPGTQMDKIDTCFRRPEIPVRTSTSNEQRSPKFPAFTLDDLPSPLSKDKTKQSDISEIETQRFSTNDTKEVYDGSIYTAETQKAVANKSDDSDENIFEMETQRPFNPDEDENDFADLETQRCDYQKSNSDKKKSIDVSIYSAETQKSVPEASVELIKNLETQQFDCRKSDSAEINSIDVSIYSAETQKSVPEAPVESVENLETQQFDCSKSDSDKRNSIDVSIYSAETQKSVPEAPVESVENLETQQFDCSKSDSDKRNSIDVSIYSAETQKSASETPVESIENLETQQFDYKKSESAKRKSNDVSIYSAETQKMVPEIPIDESIENLETQQFDRRESHSDKRKSNDVSIYSAQTQKMEQEIQINKTIENLETQEFNIRKSDKFKTPNLPKMISNQKSTHQVSILMNESVEDVETQRFHCEKSNEEKRKSSNKAIEESIENLETQEFQTTKSKFQVPDLTKRKSASKLLCNADKNISEEPVNESIENLETEHLDGRRSSTIQILSSTKRKSIDKSLHKAENQKLIPETIVNESIDDLETQQFINKSSNAIINESTEDVESQPLVDKNLKMVSSLSISAEDIDTMPFIEDKLPLRKDVQDSDVQNPEEFSFDSGFRTIEQESDNNKTDSLSSEDQNKSDIQFKKPMQSSSPHKMNRFNAENNRECITNMQNKSPTCSSSEQKLNISGNFSNKEKAEGLVEDDEEDEMFESQNLIEDCPFAYLPEESTGDNDELKTTSKEQEDKEIDSVNILNTSRDVNCKSVNKNEQSLTKKNQLITTGDESEIDEEGIFSSKEHDNKKSDCKEGDSETDEEGVFSSHLSGENESNKSSAKNNTDDIKKLYSNDNNSGSETDEEGIFSSHVSKEEDKNSDSLLKNFKNDSKSEDKISKSSFKSNADSSKKLSNKDNESDSETDEEGIFSNVLLSSKDKLKTPNDKINKSDSETDEEGIFENHSINKNNSEISSKSNQNSTIIQKSPTPDSEDNIFDENHEEKRKSAQQSEKANNLTESKKSETSLKFDNLSSKAVKAINKASSSTDANTDVDQFAPTQIVETGLFETEDMSLAPTQVINVNKSSILHQSRSDEIDDLAPTQIINAKTSLTDTIDPEDVFLAPTQIVHGRQSENLTNEIEDDFLAPTQIIPRESSPAKKVVEEFEDLDLAPTQKIDSQYCSDLHPTQIIDKKTDYMNTVVARNASIEDLDYEMAPTQIIDELESNSSKRQLDEIEITSNKKLKTDNDSQSIKADLNSTIEKDLDKMFEGPEDKPVEEDSVLLTQQLTNILESSQIDDNSQVDLNTSKPSPTLSTRRCNFKGKNRRRAMLLGKPDSPGEKAVVNLNDTIERNLNKMFDDSINTVESYESDIMMTQQLKNVLESQDDIRTTAEETDVRKKSPRLSMDTEKKKHRLSLSINLKTSSTSKNQDTKRKSRSSSVQSNLDKNKATSEKSNSNEDSQYTEEYFANLKSKKKRNVIEDSQSDDEAMDEQSSNSSEKEIVYKRGTLGFSNDLEPVSTTERVALLEPKGRSFTSDSQSDVEERLNKTLTNSPITTGKKRISLSLSKSVNLNSSLSTTSGPEVEKRISTQQKDSSHKSSLSSKKAGNSATPQAKKKSNQPATRRMNSPRVIIKRVQARGTRGFSSSVNRKPMESEELVSAASTESDGELKSSLKKVSGDCTKKLATNSSRMSGLTIIRTKRSVTSEVDDAQNQPPKRTKTAPDDERLKLQTLSPVGSAPAPELRKKKATKISNTLDSYVTLQSSKSRTDSSDLSLVETSVIESKGESSRLSKISSRTRSKATTSSAKTKVDSSNVQSNNSSKENIIVEDSDDENVTRKPTSRTTRYQRHQTSDLSALVKDSGKSEVSSSSTENQSVTRTRVTRRNQKKDEPVKEVKSVKETSVIQDSDSEKLQNSEFVNKGNRSRRAQNIIKDSDSENSQESEYINKRNRRVKDVKYLDSKEAKETPVVTSKPTRKKQIKDVKDVKNLDSEKSDKSEVSEIASSSIENESTKQTKGRVTRQNQKKGIPVKEANKSKKETSIIQDSDSEQSQESDININKGTRSRRIKDIRNLNLKKSEITIDKGTRSGRGKTRDQSSDSVVSESSDNDKEQSLLVTNKSKVSRPTRQTRKRTATTDVSVIAATSSEESQEVAEILQNCVEKDTETSRVRRGRTTRKDNISNSEDSQGSEGKNSNLDCVFEKPVSRPKRARLNKSVQNKSASEHNLDDSEDSKIDSSQKSTASRRKNNPSPLPSSLQSPSRSRRSISMSPLKKSSHKVLFTGEKSEHHRQIVTNLGGSETEDPAQCSVLVTDKVRRTFKFLCSLARGIPIVSVNWLNDSSKVHHFLDWENYILKDPVAEAKYKFKLKESLEKAKKQKLLEGYTVLLAPQITQPPISELKDMVISSGGKPLLRAPTKWPVKTVVVTKEDVQSAKKLIARAPKSVTIHTTEFILTGILRQDVNLHEFKLSV